MKPMTGIDAKFLYSETSTAHMHTLKVAVVATRDAPRWFGFDQMMTVLGQQMGTLPPLRRDRPLWELVVVDGLSDDRGAVVAELVAGSGSPG